MDYRDCVYGPCLYRKTQRRLQRMQNACAKFCFRIPPRHHVSPCFAKYSMLNMNKRRQLHLATLILKVVRNKQPRYLYSLITWSRNRHVHSTRAREQLAIIPKHKYTNFQCSLSYYSAVVWNRLGMALRSMSIRVFKDHLTKDLLKED